MSYADRDKYGIYQRTSSASPGPNLMGADTLIGDNVVNGNDEDLGDIKEIMLDMHTGQVAYAVLSFGGILGMGTKLFAVPWQALHLDTVNKRFVLNVDKRQLENAPGFDPGAWPDMSDVSWSRQIHSFYGTDPQQSGAPSMGPNIATGGMVSGSGTRSGSAMGTGMGSSLGAGSAGSGMGSAGGSASSGAVGGSSGVKGGGTSIGGGGGNLGSGAGSSGGSLGSGTAAGTGSGSRSSTAGSSKKDKGSGI